MDFFAYLIVRARYHNFGINIINILVSLYGIPTKWSERFGEGAGEATEDVLATAGHCAGTAWNIFKIRKSINPASSVSSGILKNAPRK